MKRIILTSVLACLMLAFGAVKASAQQPVRWTASAKMTSATEGVVTLTATIDKGWHLYGTKMPADGPQATTLSYGGKGIKYIGAATVGKSPKKEMDPQFGITLSFWEDTVTFSRRFTVTDPATAEAKVVVKYMSCNDQMCRPPRTDSFTVKVQK